VEGGLLPSPAFYVRISLRLSVHARARADRSNNDTVPHPSIYVARRCIAVILHSFFVTSAAVLYAGYARRDALHSSRNNETASHRR